MQSMTTSTHSEVFERIARESQADLIGDESVECSALQMLAELRAGKREAQNLDRAERRALGRQVLDDGPSFRPVELLSLAGAGPKLGEHLQSGELHRLIADEVWLRFPCNAFKNLGMVGCDHIFASWLLTRGLCKKNRGIAEEICQIVSGETPGGDRKVS